MRHQEIALPIIGLTLIAAASAPHGTRQIEILHKGCFHGTEVPAESGGEWNALYNRAGTFELVSRTIRIEPCHDGVSDAPNETTGRAVIVSGEDAPLFLVRGIGHAGENPIRIISAWPANTDHKSQLGNARFLRPGERLTLTLGSVNYQLMAKGKYDPTRPAYDRLILDYRLTLTGPGGHSQDLPAPTRFAEDGVPTVLWAGDLDRDGKLDLYMDMTDHYNVRNYVLLLSSRASGHQLLMQAASRRYVGC